MSRLSVKVVPNSSRTRIAGRYGDGLKINVSAPPERGKANEAVIKTLAEFFNIQPSAIHLIAGHTQPRKTFNITSLTAEQINQRLNSLKS